MRGWHEIESEMRVKMVMMIRRKAFRRGWID